MSSWWDTKHDILLLCLLLLWTGLGWFRSWASSAIPEDCETPSWWFWCMDCCWSNPTAMVPVLARLPRKSLAWTSVGWGCGSYRRPLCPSAEEYSLALPYCSCSRACSSWSIPLTCKQQHVPSLPSRDHLVYPWNRIEISESKDWQDEQNSLEIHVSLAEVTSIESKVMAVHAH